MYNRINHDLKRHRFEIEQDGNIAFLSYILPNKGMIEFIHTYVPEEMAGRGLGTELVKAGLDYAQEHQLEPTASCSFVANYLKKLQEK